MRKYLIALLALAPVLCFGFEYPTPTNSVRLMRYSVSGQNLNQVTYYVPNMALSDIFARYITEVNAIQFNSSSGVLTHPIQSASSALLTNKTVSVDYPILYDNHFLSITYFAPEVPTVLSVVSRLYVDGFRSSGFISVSTNSTYTFMNVRLSRVISDLLNSTNLVWRSEIISSLSQINSSVQGISSGIQNINVDLGQFQSDYQSVNYLALNPFSFTYSSMPNVGGSSDYNYAVDSVLQSPYYSDSFKSLLASSLGSAYSDYVSQAAQMYQLDQSSPGSPGYGKSFNDYLNSSGSVGASKSYHYSTPLTNEMRRMTLDWSRDTTNQLARNTANITNQLQQWKRELHNDIDNIGGALGSVITDGGGQNSLRVDIVGAGDVFNSVSIDGDITIAGTQWSTIGDGFDNVEGKLDGILNEFKKWAWDDPLGWSKYFVNFYSSHSLSNQAAEISLLSSITNILRDFSYNFTNNTEFAISNALASFSLSSTNGYLLLSDYQSFIDSSKYNAVVSSLPDDLSAALSSFGFVDSSEYSGRWWVFQSANMALQSQLALTNAALSSTLLNALSAIDDSDDSGGSLLSRWLSLIDSIPDPEEIQQSLSDATNIVSNIGFERADALYSTATQDLVSVVKGIYRDKSLPDNIRFVFIPAAQGREEKFVDIPVGEHSSLWSLFRSGMAFALSVVTLILFPKYVSWLVAHYTRLVERIIKSLHAYTHQ